MTTRCVWGNMGELPLVTRDCRTRPMNRRVSAAITFAFLGACMTARGQTLWEGVSVGMPPADVSAKRPMAEKVSGANSLAGGEAELLREAVLVGPGMPSIPTELRFYFLDNQLYRVNWFVNEDFPDFQAAVERYEGVLAGLKRDFPVNRELETSRQLNLSRFLSDTWVTKEGVRINVTLFDALPPTIPIRFRVGVSAEGGAWARMKESVARERAIADAAAKRTALEAAQAADAARLRQELAMIKRSKQQDEDSYGESLQRWVGRDISALARVLGAPTSTTQLPNGEVAYAWDKKQGELVCRTSMFAAQNGTITTWQWTGSNCRRPIAGPSKPMPSHPKITS